LDSSGREPSGKVCATVLFWRPHEVPLVEQCVASLLGQSLRPHVIVVDNGCGATPALPAGAHLLRLPENRGFTGGHNAGMRAALEAGADFVFLVNSDVVVDPNCVGALVNVALSWPEAGMLGPLVLRARGADEVESSGQAFNDWTGRHRELGRGVAAAAITTAPHAVDAVSGCALFARRSVLQRVGLLDESLFFYFEDMDWCLRARRVGFLIGVVPAARVWHRGGGSTRPNWTGTTFYSVRNHLVVASRYGHRAGRWVRPFLVLGFHVAFLLRSREHRSAAHLSALMRGTFAAWRARMGQQAELAGSR